MRSEERKRKERKKLNNKKNSKLKITIAIFYCCKKIKRKYSLD
jgi:hypothetical protein